MNHQKLAFPFLISTAVAASAFAQNAETPATTPAVVPTSQGTNSTSAAVAAPAPTRDQPGTKSPYLPEPQLFEIGIFGGAFFPSSHHTLLSPGRQFAKYETAPELGLRLAYFPLAFLGAELEGAVMPSKVENGGGAGLWAVRGHLIAQLTASRITPFVLAGVGALGAYSKEMGKDVDNALHFGIGAKAALDEVLSARLDVRDTLTRQTDRNARTAHYPEVLLGLSVTLDRSKPPPEAPPPPPDADKDGVPDATDACPRVAGVAPSGCPADTDKDGVPDAMDKCPAAAGPAPTGCPPPPDRDKDGVVDAWDECPDVPAQTANGCPDLDPDKDGILGDKDKCPNVPETVNGFQDDDGCPDEVPEAVKRFTGVIQGIEFDLGKATIRAVSRPLLDKAVATLKEHTSVNLKITGHTDNVGKREHNLELSLQRATEVKKYMVSKGVDAQRITTRGAGPDEPLSNENTAQARQMNRRIEFSIK